MPKQPSIGERAFTGPRQLEKRNTGLPPTRRYPCPRDPDQRSELDATEIQVEVERGAVTLTGIVDSREAKLLAAELVESVVGVREVHNDLTVTR